jgi:DNA-binding transcriptional ArsR family regulator
MPIQDSIVVPYTAPVTIALEPAHNAIHSLLLLTQTERLSGLGDWVIHTVSALTPQERRRHELVLIGLHYAVLPEQSWPSFPAYLNHLATLDPNVLRDKMLATYARFLPMTDGAHRMGYGEPQPIDLEAILEDADSYLNFLRARFEASKIDTQLETDAYSYVIDPPAMQELIVSHLQKMWEEHLAPEWERVEPMLQDAVSAFQHVDVSDMSRLEATRLITGQEFKEEKWKKEFERLERLIFVPSAHVGPYLGKMWGGDVLWLLFGARLPEGIQFHAPDLSRAEIVVRLSALANDNRLQILKLVSDRGELSSQDIMAGLGLSQSTASRHLKQLKATGYLAERRCNGAKCYTLDSERIRDTLRAVSSFLLIKT